MKKRILLLPLLILSLAACDPIKTSIPEGSTESNTGSTPSGDPSQVTVTGISATYPVASSTYTVGESFDIVPLVVKLNMSDSTQRVTDAYSLEPINHGYIFTEDDIGSFVVTVKYNLDQSITATFTLTIVAPEPASLVDIEIAHAPNKTHYTVGEAYDPTGIVVNEVYDNEARVPISYYTSSIEPGYVFVAGDVGVITTVTITHETFEKTFAIEIALEETLEDKCDNMNSAISLVSIANPFEARDYLVDEGYGYVVDAQEDSKYFGYDYEDNRIVIYNMTTGNSRNAIYPSSSENHEIVSYQAREVANKEDLLQVVTNVGIGVGNYSTIRITSNITLDDTIAITSSEPFEFDFTDKTVNSSVTKDVFRINGENAVINFKATTGGIETIVDNEPQNLGSQTAPSCISALNFKEITLDSVKLICNARYGYGIIDSLYARNDSFIKVRNCNNINAVTNAICIVKSALEVNSSFIRGVINVSGGLVTIEDTTVTAVGRHDDATGLVPDELVINTALYLYESNYTRYGSYSVSATDPIIIFDRRGLYDTYDNPIVNIGGETHLIADYENEVVYGYGIRYIDLNLGSKTTRGQVIVGGGVSFDKCSASNPLGAAGGINVALPN